jgi:hypothetical protein
MQPLAERWRPGSTLPPPPRESDGANAPGDGGDQVVTGGSLHFRQLLP